MRRTLLMLAVLLLGACSSGIEGTYSDPTGVVKYEFESGGKVYMTLLGAKVEQKYVVDGKHVKVISGGNTQIFTRLDDGSLEGPLSIKLKKQP